MMDLSSDKRTRNAYKAARKRAKRGTVAVPASSGPAAHKVGAVLEGDEVVSWLGWAHDHRPQDGGGDWWLLLLTSFRLVATTNTTRDDTWKAGLRAWHTERAGADLILWLPERADALWVPAVGKDETLFLGMLDADAARPRTVSAAARPAPEPALDVGPDVAPATVARDDQASDDGSSAHVVSDWRTAEALAAWHMERLGLTGATLTASGADQGIDVVADDAVAQVKHFGTPVGAPVVQQLRGAAHGVDWALFYALSGYTDPAVRYADSANVALFSYTTGGHVAAVNAAARYLEEKAGAGEGFDASEFEMRQQAQRRAQDAFDRAVSIFTASAQGAIGAYESNPAAEHLLDEVRVESRRVERAIRNVSDRGTLPMSEFVAVAQEIIEAAERLAIEVERYQR